MILSDRDIRRRLEMGDIEIEPLDDPELQIQPASVDLRLGTEFLTFQSSNIHCIRPNRSHEIASYVEKTTIAGADADGQQSLREFEADADATVEEAQREFILHPGDFVLGTTKERVAIPPDLMAHVEGRSSLGRLAVVVHASLPAHETVFLWTPEDGFGFYEIGPIVEEERAAHAVAFDPTTLRVGTYPITNYLKRPTKRIYRVTLESGRQVEVTRDHNVFTIDAHGGVTRVPSEDAEGELVMVPNHLPGPRGTERELDLLALLEGDDDIIAYASDGLGEATWGADGPDSTRRHRENGSAATLAGVSSANAPRDAEIALSPGDVRVPRFIDVTPAFGWVLGRYIAGGSIRHEHIHISDRDPGALDRAAAWFGQFDTDVDRTTREDGRDHLTVRSTLWATIFERIAGAGRQKTIPDRAWNWDRDVLEALLEALLARDGHNRDGRETLSPTNESLADRTMYLAARLGLLGSMHPRPRDSAVDPSDGSTSTSACASEWGVEVREPAHQRGQDVPVPSAHLRTLREEAGLTIQEAADTMGYSSTSSITRVENGERDTLKRTTLDRFRTLYANEGAETRRLDQLLDGDIRFERVTSIERTDRVEPTYDLEVQPRGRAIENFLGGRGGIYLSNTAGLCDPGYEGQVTLELSNLGTAPVALTPDMRIAQLTFTELTSPAERPYGAERGSKYQGQRGPQASRLQNDPEFDNTG